MEKNRELVSQHQFLTFESYTKQGKMRTVLKGWVFYFVVLAITQIPPAQTFLLNLAQSVRVDWVSSNVNFLINGWWYTAIFFAVGTFIEFRKKQIFDRLDIYKTGISFVESHANSEKYVDFANINMNPGKMRKSFFIEAKSVGLDSEYGWDEFEQADVLENNLKRYGNYTSI